MATQEVAKDKYICTEDQTLEAIHVIASGSVSICFQGREITLKKGDVVGLLDIAFDTHSFNYKTAEDSSFISFPRKSADDFASLIKQNPEVGKMIYNSSIYQVAQIFSVYEKSVSDSEAIYDKVKALYEAYIDICAHNNIIPKSLPAMEALAKPSLEERVPIWIVNYYKALRDFPQELKISLYARSAFLSGIVLKASTDVRELSDKIAYIIDTLNTNASVIMNESGLDLFDLYSLLLLRLKSDTHDYEIVKRTLNEMVELVEINGYVGSELIRSRVTELRSKLSAKKEESDTLVNGSEEMDADLQNATDIILEYSNVEDETIVKFKTLLTKYKSMPDKSSYDDNSRRLRQEITSLFYHIYSESFIMSTRDKEVPTVLKMFFNFGFVDAELAGMSNARYLYNLAQTFNGDPENGVYTAYEWLKAIYRKEKEPSRNEFDVDYMESLHERRKQGQIDAEQERMLAEDSGERVLFELTNLFPSVNKVTYGRLTTFCPLMSEHDMIKSLDDCIVTPEAVLDAYSKLESVDYGAFYRESVYSNDSIGISKEAMYIRVLPDIILMPNIGTRGVMWQEIEGKKRSTPSRYAVSVFHLEDLSTTLLRLVGEYRWEMCKRIQGGRWNDVSEKSLTSEYFDYIQFYKKNNELSPDAKEKIRQGLIKAKNSFKEMFVRDYITWVMFEGAGSPRLNKLSRAIFCTYCPFPYELRQKVGANPLFKSLLEKYEIKLSQKLHHFDNVIQKISAAGTEIPEELIKSRNYIIGKV